MIKRRADFYSINAFIKILSIVGIYLFFSSLIIGFKIDQLILSAIFISSYFSSITGRKFILAFSIFIVYWILFDYMKAFPNYVHNKVHILELYNTEKSLFGIYQNGIKVTPNEFWLSRTSTYLDILSGLFYLCWIPVPLAFAAWLFFKDKAIFLQFAFSFVIVNMLGFIIYYVYPAAPPWYLMKYGVDLISDTKGNTAGLQRFDDYVGIGIFDSLYAKSSNVFAAMPSLHSAYPVLVLYYGIKKKIGWVNIIFALVMLGIWFAAIYTSHHYLLDVLAGITCAIITLYLFQKWVLKSALVKRFLQFYLSKI